MECLLPRSISHADCKILRSEIRPPGSTNDDPASRRPEAQPEPDADRRRRQTRQVVLRVEAGAVGWDGKASPRRTGRTALAQLASHRSKGRFTSERKDRNVVFLAEQFC